MFDYKIITHCNSNEKKTIFKDNFQFYKNYYSLLGISSCNLSANFLKPSLIQKA